MVEQKIPLSKVWIEETVDFLYNIYKDKISKKQIEEFVLKKFSNNYKKVIGNWRSIYTFTQGIENIDNVLVKLYNDNNILCANGSIIYNPLQEASPLTPILDQNEKTRDEIKAKMFEAVQSGDNKRKRSLDGMQYSEKVVMNSMYGSQTQKGSILSSTDSASAITTQGREWISEMMWSIEKYLLGNICLKNSNEFYRYFQIISRRIIDESFLKYLSYYPTIDDCIEKIFDMVSGMDDRKDFLSSNGFKRIIEKIKSFSDIELIKFYYVDNLKQLILKNTIFQQIFIEIINIPDNFYDPYDIPESYRDKIDFLWNITKNFVYSNINTYDRVNKYMTRKRKCILMSDTDSVMVCLDEVFDWINCITNNQYKLKEDQNIRFKIVNTLSSLISNVCNNACYRLSSSCNVPEDQRKRLKMKNEFLFLRMILFTSVKKNYATLSALQEGRIIPEKDRLVNTGGKLTSSNIIQEIKERMNQIIRYKILEPPIPNPIEVWRELIDLENHIRNEIKSGNKHYLLISKYRGMVKGYANPEGHDVNRAVTIWNRLYGLEHPISAYETIYKAKTIVLTEEDAEKYITDPIWKEKVLDLVFDKYGKHRREFIGQDFRAYGLKTIAINAMNGNPEKIPEWLIPIIDVDSIIDQHTRVLKDLLVSIGLHQTKINSKKSKTSTLINF